MIAFIDDHREAHALKPICKVLPIVPSTYHARAARRADPAKKPARARRDEVLPIGNIPPAEVEERFYAEMSEIALAA